MTMSELLERRDAILAELEDENTPAERVDELETEGRSVAEQIERQNAAQKKAQETRASLLRIQPNQGNGNAAAFTISTQGPVVDTGQPNTTSAPNPEVRQDPLNRFITSERFVEFRERGYRGRLGFDWPNFVHEVRAPLDTGATSAGAFTQPMRVPGISVQTNADRPLRLADLIDRQNTGTSTVEYVRDTTAAGAGGAAAETAEGAAKPEAPMSFEVVTDTVRTVAHWVQITRQAADDNAQILGYVRGRLAYGLDYRLDAQIINGNGTSPNLRGILNTSGINTVAPGAAEARVISIRKAITQCQVDEYAPTAAVLHPVDWELVELSTDNNGMFRVTPNVANALAPRIWGLNVVPTTAIASGTGLVGDFRMGATLWDRQDTQIFLTDSHASTFTSNILTLLAELRAALSVWRPSAFCKITFNGGV